MDRQARKVFELDWLAKFLFFIAGAALFAGPICVLCGIFLSVLQEQMKLSFGFIVLTFFLLIIIIAGIHMLLSVSAKVTVTSDAVIQSNLIKTIVTSLDSILSVKYVWISSGRGGANLLFIQTTQSSFYINNGFSKKVIDEAVAYILEQIRLYYPENYSSVINKMGEDAKKKESAAVANFW